MTTFTYAQLEGLWIDAGGAKALAPLMAAIATAESGGNSLAKNPSGATGVWQILGAVDPSDQSQLTNPQINAKEAVLKYKSQGLGAWTTYTSGAYKKYLKGKVPPNLSPGGSNQSTTPSGNQQAQLTSFLGGNSGGVLADAGGLLHGAAVVIDRLAGMFAPGQGWRFVFGLGALVLVLLGAKAFMGGGAVLPV